MIPSHATLPIDHVEAILWDDRIDADTRKTLARLEAIRAEDDAAALFGDGE